MEKLHEGVKGIFPTGINSKSNQGKLPSDYLYLTKDVWYQSNIVFVYWQCTTSSSSSFSQIMSFRARGTLESNEAFIDICPLSASEPIGCLYLRREVEREAGSRS